MTFGQDQIMTKKTKDIRSLTWEFLAQATTDTRAAVAFSAYLLPALNTRGRRELLAERVEDGVASVKSVVGRSRAFADLLIYVRDMVATATGATPPAPVVFGVVVDFLRPSYMHLGENFIENAIAKVKRKMSPAEGEFFTYLTYLLAIAVSSACGLTAERLEECLKLSLSSVFQYVANAYSPSPVHNRLEAEILLVSADTNLPLEWMNAAIPLMRDDLISIRYLWSALKRCRLRRKTSVLDLLEDALAYEVRVETHRIVRNMLRVVKQAGDDHLVLLSVLSPDQLADVMLNRKGRGNGNEVAKDLLADKATKLKALMAAREADRLLRQRMEIGAALAEKCFLARRAEPWQLDRIKDCDPALYSVLETRLTALLSDRRDTRPTRAYGKPRAPQRIPEPSAMDDDGDWGDELCTRDPSTQPHQW